MKKKGRIGSSFDDFLKEEKIYTEVTARAIKRIIARQLDTLMQDEGLTKSALAKRMQTSRAQLDRLLDPDCAYRRSRPPVPIDRDQCGAGADGAVG